MQNNSTIAEETKTILKSFAEELPDGLCWCWCQHSAQHAFKDAKSHHTINCERAKEFYKKLDKLTDLR